MHKYDPLYFDLVSGFVCNRTSVDSHGCCNVKVRPRSTSKHRCDTCLKNACCVVYEYCVSCCLKPDKVWQGLSNSLDYVFYIFHLTVYCKPTFICERRIFVMFMRTSWSQIFLNANQCFNVSYICSRLSWSGKLVAVDQFTTGKSRNNVITSWFTVPIFECKLEYKYESK